MGGRRSRVETIVRAMGGARWSGSGDWLGLAQRNPTVLSVKYGAVQVVAGRLDAVGGGWARAGDRPERTNVDL